VSIGVKAGVRLTPDLDTYYADSESKRFPVGPMVVVSPGLGFRIESNALYTRVGLRSSGTDIVGGQYATRYTGNAWEFPILLRHGVWRGVYGELLTRRG
jgi:hypothetical protein